MRSVVYPAPAEAEKGERGLRGLDGKQGLKGDKGDRGERGLQGEPGRDAALVPSMALFERDEATKLTTFVQIATKTGDLIATILPIRDDDGFMTAADIEPAVS